MSRPSRRCSARSWSITRRSTASRPSSSRRISMTRCTARIFEAAVEADPRRQARHADHAQDLLPGRSAGRRAARAAISRPACGQRHHHHQCRGLRPHRLRPRHPPPAHPDRRGDGQHRLRFADRRAARRADRGAPSSSFTSWPRPGNTASGFEPFSSALTDAIDMAANAYRRDGGLSGLATGFTDLDQQHGRPAALRPDHRRRTSRHGQDGARHQHRLSRGQDLPARAATPRTRSTAPWSASSRSKCRPSSSPPASSPSSPLSRRSASAAAASMPTSSTASSRSRRSCSTCLFISTRPAASPSLSSRPARGG